MTVKRREPVTSKSKNLLDKKVPVFKSGTIKWKNVRQQNITNCPLPATLAAIAKVCPTQIELMIEDTKAAYESWFDGEPPKARFTGNRILVVHFHDGWFVRLTPWLYFGSNGTLFAKSTDGGGWVSYIEKAYVIFRGHHTYEYLDASKSPDPPSVDQVFLDLAGPFDKIQIIGEKPDVFLNNDKNGTHANREYSKDYLKEFLSRADTRPTIATTFGSGTRLIGNHTYVIERFDGKTKTVHVWEAMRDSSEKVPLKDFFEEFDATLQARSTRC